MGRMGTGLRCFVASLVFLCLAGHSLALAAGVSCQNNNPFIKIMATQGIKLYTEPKKVDSICRSEFAEYGTCCDPSQLEAYAQKDKAQIETTHKKLVDEVQTLVAVTRRVVGIIEALTLSKYGRFDPVGEGRFFKHIRAARDISRSQNFLDLKKSLGALTPKILKQFEEENHNCWTKLADERSASICATCSGRSNHFFSDGKILISQNKCEQLSQICEGPMAVITQIVIGVRALFLLQKQFADAGFGPQKGPNANPITRVTSTVVKAAKDTVLCPIQNLFKTSFGGSFAPLLALLVASDANSKSGDRRSTKCPHESLCNKFVRMREPVLLEDMEKILDTASKFKFELGSQVEKFIFRRKNNISAGRRTRSAVGFAAQHDMSHKKHEQGNWRIGGRVLQFSKSPQSLGSDAQFVDPTDPSYSSVGVSGHGPVADGSSFP